ncbi:MAG: DUF421 domain-containing protein [Clostridiales bacterium]|nr:DUF421 domain-containing protein [Clostridiales bacterium]
MGLIFIRTSIIFITLLIIMRLMGKRQIGEMQPYEFVITLIIAELACIPMGDPAIPLTYGIVAILSIYFLHQVVCLIDLKWPKGKKLISGTPAVVLNKNGIDDYQLKKNNLNVTDLIESLRVAGYFSLDAVDYALYESNGSLSVLPKTDYEETQNSLPLVLVSEGQFDANNLTKTQKTKEYFLNVFKEQGCDELKNILLCTIDGNGKLYIQNKGKRYQTLRLKWEEKLW